MLVCILIFNKTKKCDLLKKKKGVVCLTQVGEIVLSCLVLKSSLWDNISIDEETESQRVPLMYATSNSSSQGEILTQVYLMPIPLQMQI